MNEPTRHEPESLASVIASTTRALAASWQDPSETEDPTTRQRYERGARQTALERVREQVPLHCRGPRAELVQRMADKLFRAVDAWRWGDPNLVLLGGTGAGKTTAAAYLVRRLCALAVEHGGEQLEKAQLIRWQSCRELTSVIREYPLGEGAPDTLARCQNARLLVLDDLGAGDDKMALERIMDVRYMRGWPTITTSGLSHRELAVSQGEHLVRRLAETKGRRGRVLQVFPATKGEA